MSELVVISGKGGTGKTSVAGALAVLAGEGVFADCDVDAANLALILSAERREEHEFYGGEVARIDLEKCDLCGTCWDACRFGAIERGRVDPTACEGCGLCARLCGTGAATMVPRLSGRWFISRTPWGPLVHARLGIAQENSGRLVTLVRDRARRLAGARGEDTVMITDGPPGIGCPVIASLSGATLALLVTEPTLSGIHDLKRVLDVCRHFDVPAAACINRYDLSLENTAAIGDWCRGEGVPLLGRIPTDHTVTRAQVAGRTLADYAAAGGDDPGPALAAVRRLWGEVRRLLVEGDGKSQRAVRKGM